MDCQRGSAQEVGEYDALASTDSNTANNHTSEIMMQVNEERTLSTAENSLTRQELADNEVLHQQEEFFTEKPASDSSHFGGTGVASSYSVDSQMTLPWSKETWGKNDVESQTPFEDNSPVEEVRAIVPVTDDPTMPTNTFRMWFLALFFTFLVSFVNQFFYLRQNPVSITYTVVSLISLPIGNFMARTLPTRQFRIFGYQCSFNPGPFNIKEHALIGTAVACCSGTAYAVDIVILQKKYYGDDQGFLAGFMLVLTTQITGFSLAGVLRKFLVKPAHMIWPANLVTVALFRT
ncbi:hypothetical protein BGX26_000139 [Mortierella sp. AD094]|nr:hypothetical protein BGX26_000139 [Mortierella sp. AD094]